MGLSFDELFLFTMQDFVDYTDIWIDMMSGSDGDTERPATQADIDRFF